MCGHRYPEIAYANHLANPSALWVGQMLTIPGKKAPSKATESPPRQGSKGQLGATLKLAGLAEVDVDLSFTATRAGAGWRVVSDWDLRLARLLFWSLGKKKPGFRVKGLLNIQGKAGEESFRLLSVGLIPQLQSGYPAVAKALTEKK